MAIAYSKLLGIDLPTVSLWMIRAFNGVNSFTVEKYAIFYSTLPSQAHQANIVFDNWCAE